MFYLRYVGHGFGSIFIFLKNKYIDNIKTAIHRRKKTEIIFRNGKSMIKYNYSENVKTRLTDYININASRSRGCVL